MIHATIVDSGGAPEFEEEHENVHEAWHSLRDAYIRSMDQLGREVNGYMLLLFATSSDRENATVVDPDGFRYSVTLDPNYCAGGEWSGGRWLECATTVDQPGGRCTRHRHDEPS